MPITKLPCVCLFDITSCICDCESKLLLSQRSFKFEISFLKAYWSEHSSCIKACTLVVAHIKFFWLSNWVTETIQGKKLNRSSISVRCTWKVSWKTNYLVRWWRRKAKSQIDQIVFIFELPPHPTFIFSVRTKRNSSTKILFNGFLVYDTFWSEKRLISLSYDWYLIVPRCHIVVKIGLNSDLFYNPSHCFLWTTTRFSVSRLKSELSSL